MNPSEIHATQLMLDAINKCFTAYEAIAHKVLCRMEELQHTDTLANDAKEYLEMFLLSTIELKLSFQEDVESRHNQTNKRHMQLDFKLVARLLAILLQMRRNHDWIRNTMGCEIMLARQPGEQLAYALATFFDEMEEATEECMRSFDDYDCSHGSYSKALEAKDTQDPTVPVPLSTVEKNIGQIIDFDS